MSYHNVATQHHNGQPTFKMKNIIRSAPVAFNMKIKIQQTLGQYWGFYIYSFINSDIYIFIS
jgi:hypothetical protein